MQNFLRLLSAFGFSMLIAACGGGGGGGSNNQTSSSTPTAPTGDNVQAISVNGGATGAVNVAYTSITVCVPGTAQCKTIDNVLVDTGSTGLRVLSSALIGLSLPQQPLVASHSLAECISFLDGTYVWGPVRTADVKIGGKTAASLQIHVLADSSYGTAPATCLKNSNPLVTPEEATDIQTLGGNAILGVGTFREDCGAVICSNPHNDYYYDCSPTAGCVETAADINSQVQNPVALFATDNNGVIIQLPAISNSGAASANGWMIFGIDTRDNNARGSATVFTLTGGVYLRTIYKGTTYPQSFVDSGSNGLYFSDSSITKCSSSDPLFSFYCPSSTLSLSAVVNGQNNNSATISFSVANLNMLNGNFSAFNDIAGSNGSSTNSFDWGLPFFFGRKIYTALETNPEGPYIAF